MKLINVNAVARNVYMWFLVILIESFLMLTCSGDRDFIYLNGQRSCAYL